MSALHTYQTKWTEAEVLSEAVINATDGKLRPEIHQKPVNLKGNDTSYWQQSAEVIIPRSQMQSWHDVGFQKQADGTFKVLMSDMDGRHMNKQLLAKIGREYAAASQLKMLRARGYTQFEREEITNDKGEVELLIRAKTPVPIAAAASESEAPRVRL